MTNMITITKTSLIMKRRNHLTNQNITKTKKTIKLAQDIPGYWYHKGHWIDMNGDGKKDLLIARTNYREGGGRLVWLENPG